MLKTTIPFIDLRGKTLLDLLRAYPDKARDLLSGSKRTLGVVSQVASVFAHPLLDARSRAWLKKAKNPYLHEIESFSGVLGKRGVVALNIAYEWACTSGAYATGETVSMLRVLDWPFPALGKHVVVALQSGKAGEFYNITWPALSGMYQGVAKGRFAAAINLAPMRKHGLGYVGDWFKNRLIMNKQRALPPSHLLRMVFENAKDYAEAKEMLCKIPIAAPVIFTLTGIKQGQGCIIERLEDSAEIMELTAGQCVTASNQFHSGFAKIGKGWRSRALDSAGRYKQSCTITAEEMKQENLSWLRPPILNAFTRLVMRADAATGRFDVQGYEGQSAVTESYSLSV